MTDLPITDAVLQEACAAFAFRGTVCDVKPCGNGHINHTFIITTDENEMRRRYILQVLNTDIFRDPDGVMENIVRVTEHIRAGLLAAGGDAERGCLHVVRSSDSTATGIAAYRYVDRDGRFWRAYDFVEHTVCRLTMDSPDTFRMVGWAFGNFQHQLSDFDASCLHESIPDFHNTKKRYAAFLDTLSRDPVGRVANAAEEIAFLTARQERGSLIVDDLAAGRLPLRVTHNDTKLSNILLDETTGAFVCVIDLDTVMPGLAANDFGDSIRFGANTGAEDEKDLKKISLSLARRRRTSQMRNAWISAQICSAPTRRAL